MCTRLDVDKRIRSDDVAMEFIVLTEDDEIIGSVVVGYDGHRGWINSLACHPDHRRRGVATELMAAARELLLDRGCPKINLQVRVGNKEAQKFYRSLGYSEDAVTSFGLRLIPDT